MERVAATDVTCRHTLHNAQAFRVLPDQLEPLLVGGINFEERFVRVLLVLESQNLVLHRILLSTSPRTCFGGIRIAGAWYKRWPGMSSGDIAMSVCGGGSPAWEAHPEGKCKPLNQGVKKFVALPVKL